MTALEDRHGRIRSMEDPHERHDLCKLLDKCLEYRVDQCGFGPLHFAMANGNLSDDDVLFVLAAAENDGDMEAWGIAKDLLEIPEEWRLLIHTMVWHVSALCRQCKQQGVRSSHA